MFWGGAATQMATMESSSSSEEEPTILGRLFSEERVSCNSSEEEDYSESDREWRDAVKAAVETEIQYQVQLRLSLDTPTRKHRGKPVVEDSGNEPVSSTKQTNKSTLEADGDRYQTKAPKLIPPRPSDTPLDGKKDRVLLCNIAMNQNQLQLPSKANGTAEAPAAKPEKKEPQTVYEYLNQKYGVPFSQLNTLISEGRLRCNDKRDLPPGIDERVNWPIECNIVKPPPVLSTNHLQKKGVPFFPDGPMLGHVRPTFQRAKEHCHIVFDRENGTQVTEDGVLMFESRFESGNLQQAIKVGQNEYDLILATDLYTGRHTQWFYFQVSGHIEAGVPYTFNILNFRKTSSLYNNGMKLLMYSEASEGWTRVGQNICYRRLPVCNHTPLLKHGTEYYYLSWKVEFPHDNDSCYFAHCYPYTYSHLLKTLDTYEEDARRKEYFRREELCKTLAGNTCPLITITDYRCSKEEWSGRMGVVFSARIHPGETNSSWMMDGVLEYLTSDHKHARYLRSKFIFKIIPMLNPDGVIIGNYRTSLSGVDLNRVFKNPIEKVFPTVSATKRLIQDFNEERKIALYVDLHGHSRTFNVFMYGCHTPQCNHQEFLEERAVPWMLSQISKEKFSFKKCKFAVQRCKEATGRVSIWREGIANSFTMEASFCGTNLTKPTPVHFTSEDLSSVGKDLCEVLLKIYRYNKSNSYRFKVNSAIAEYLLGTVEEGGGDGPLPPPLPDLVTSTTGRGQQGKGDDEERTGGQNGKRRTRQQMARTLQRFHGVAMNRLEVESSTSGSDSDDDNFTFTRHKSRSKNKHKKHKKSSHKQQPPVTNHDTKLPKIESSLPLSTQSQMDCGAGSVGADKHKNSASKSSQQHSTVNSAPPRLQGGGHAHPQHGWRFVNKYVNRSNGGIPMFSEERLKERAEKKEKLKSLSQIQSSEAVQLPPVLGSPSAAAVMPPISTIRRPTFKGSDTPLNLPSLTWKPVESQQEIPVQSGRHHGEAARDRTLQATIRGRGGAEHLDSASLGAGLPLQHRRRHSDVDSSLIHYKNIKKLVETHKKFSTEMQQPHPRAKVGVAGHGPPALPAGMPPQLSQYISEIWRKHSGNF